MTLISEDVAAHQGLTVDTRSQKKVRAVNGQRLNNSGTVTFGIKYQGRTTEVEALVSLSIEGEVLLSWQVLQQLGVNNNSFPNVEIKAAVVSTTVQSNDIGNERDAKSRLNKMIKEFDRVFNEDGLLRTMKGDPMKIHIKPDVKVIPLNVCTPRKTPIAYMDEAKKKIESDLQLDIIEKVDGVSRWCSPMSFVPKPNGKVRSVVDLVQLNKFVDRPTHPFPASKDIVSRIPTGSKCFAFFDCTHGYWQIPLEEESRPYTCFQTEWGRYQYKRAPMGLVSSGDEFCARTDRALAGIDGVFKLVDDILIYGESHAQLLHSS
jgi:hypothetical protein